MYVPSTALRTQLIYISVLVAVIITLFSLPFIYTTVSISGAGLLQSDVEKTELLAPASGRLVKVNLLDNQKVNKGKTLLVLDAALSQQQGALLGKNTGRLQMQLHDAQLLSRFVGVPNAQPTLQTGIYQAGWQQFQEQWHNATNAKQQAQRIYQRYKTLYDKRVVTLAEYEQYKFNYEQALSDELLVAKKYKAQWQTEANQYLNELRGLQREKYQLAEEEKQYILRAPVSGSLQNLTGLQVGSFVYANQKVGEISPDSNLLAFCYVKPADIGLINKNQEVRLQIDAFNYNQWGLLKGQVLDIADDIVMQNNVPYFKVKCKLNKNYLQLKNGYKGYVKKGMTFNARFTVARRSLYQLLYDKVDNWVNPANRKN